MSKGHDPHCGLCQVPVTDCKAHSESKEHWDMVEKVAKDPSSSYVMQAMAAKLLTERSLKQFKEAKDNLMRGLG